MSQTKLCKRCSQTFDCNTDQIENCFCSSLNILSGTVIFLKKTKYDCLCSNCLTEVNNLVKESEGDVFPVFGDKYVEGKHYYLENGNWVFTEFYHLLRGTCCGNACRHCAYGFGK